MKLSRLPVFALLVLLVSCSGSAPAVINTDYVFVYTRDDNRGGVYEELNFFAQVEDADGLEDISEISIHRDDLGWAWTLGPEEWVSFSKDGEDWIGAAGLTAGAELPGGDYRLTVADRSGKKEESEFRLSNPGVPLDQLRFPDLSCSDRRISVRTGGADAAALWFYSSRGDFITEKYTRQGMFMISDFLSPDEEKIAAWVTAYVQDEEGGYGLKSGPCLLAEE